MTTVKGSDSDTIAIECKDFFQQVEVRFPGGYTIKVAVRARYGDVASIYGTPPNGEFVHLVSVTDQELIELKAQHHETMPTSAFEGAPLRLTHGSHDVPSRSDRQAA
jgi:hypothetical protein